MTLLRSLTTTTMTALLPAINISPFRKPFDEGSSTFFDPLVSSHTSSQNAFSPSTSGHRTDAVTSGSLPFTAHKPVAQHNPPLGGLSTHVATTMPPRKRPLAASGTDRNITELNVRKTASRKSLLDDMAAEHVQKGETFRSIRQRRSSRNLPHHRDMRKKRNVWSRLHNDISGTKCEPGSSKTGNKHDGPVQPLQLSLEPFPSLQLPETQFEKHNQHDHNHKTSPAAPARVMPSTPDNGKRRRGLSDASSAFVHTIKTASMSNGSFSIHPRSFRFGRSSESDTYLNRHLRCSLDSERPRTTSSMDEAAFLRGMKRRQIINELVTSEGSYIADLKALLYLYTTLLASATAISSTTRLAIQRNVTGLLQLHETIQDRLHHAAFSAAARKWADTTSPTRLGRLHYSRWRNGKAGAVTRRPRRHRQVRSSTDSTEMARAAFRLGSADPVDVLDIVNIFQQRLTCFLAYEEYCANHEIIAHELQRQTPTLWSTYEAGMESLGRLLSAIDQKPTQGRKSLTVADLLIKPIQRICRYPLLLDDLLRNTPVADSPEAHNKLESVLLRLREIVLAVNLATDSHQARSQIQQRWLIQDRLNLYKHSITADRFRELGFAHLCGVLYVTYQTVSTIDECYALCVLFDRHFLVAKPTGDAGRFDLLAIISLPDIKIESVGDGKGECAEEMKLIVLTCVGMQCQSAFHTWKLCFVVHGNMHELLLSACSITEENQWLHGLKGGYKDGNAGRSPASGFNTQLYLDLKCIGVIFTPETSPSRQSPIQRAGTVGSRANIAQIILRNTHNPQDLQEFRGASSNLLNRSQSHASTCKVVVLAPKRSERSKLENMLSDVWTKEKLPYPGMIANRGTQILRASAGSLVRKLSLASIHTPFSRRSTSLTVSSHKSYEALREQWKTNTPNFQIRRGSTEECIPIRTNRPKEWSELDTMDSVIERMISGGLSTTRRMSFSGGEKLLRKGAKNSGSKHDPIHRVSPGDSAEVFYEDDEKVEEAVRITRHSEEQAINIEEGLSGANRRKRWSNPIAMLKGFGSDGIRHMLHSSK